MIVLCAGMVRSGSTLQYNMARCMVEEMSIGVGEGFLEDPSGEKTQALFQRWLKDDVFHIVKTHTIPADSVEMSVSGSMCVCYIYRDLRDVAVSLKNKGTAQGRQILVKLDEAIAQYNKAREIHPVLWQKYEEVIEDIPGAIKALAQFLGTNVDPQTVQSVAQSLSIENARQIADGVSFRLLEKAIGFLRKLGVSKTFLSKIGLAETYDKRTLLNPGHISKNAGKTGAWRNGLSVEEIDMILERYREWLEREGYAL